MPLTQLELRDGLAGLGDDRLLAGDGRQVADGPVHYLGVAGGVADTHVDHDLHQTRDLHDVVVGELVVQRRADLLAVLLLQPRGGTRRGRHLAGGHGGRGGRLVGDGRTLLGLAGRLLGGSLVRGGHQISFPVLRETRTARVPLYSVPSERRLVTSERL